MIKTLDLVSMEYIPIQPPVGIKFTKLAKTRFGIEGMNLIELGDLTTRHIMHKLKIARKEDLFPILERVKITLIFE